MGEGGRQGGKWEVLRTGVHVAWSLQDMRVRRDMSLCTLLVDRLTTVNVNDSLEKMSSSYLKSRVESRLMKVKPSQEAVGSAVWPLALHSAVPTAQGRVARV